MANVIRLGPNAVTMRLNTKNIVADFFAEYPKVIPPCLAILQVVGDTASDVYTRRKKEAVLDIGGVVRHIMFPCTVDPQVVRRVINDLNSDPTVHGIILQLPVPWNEEESKKTLNAITPAKDVDGLGKEALSALAEGEYWKHFHPCTPRAVTEVMWDYVSATSNPNVLIIGRSRLVGKPLAMMLEVMWDCTVTLAHSKTSQESINNLSATADVVVVATGTPKGIRLPHVNPNALIIDVGVNKDETGTLCGDVDHSSLPKEVSITASPGGVGLLTVECLCTNLISAWRNQWLKEHPSC